MGAREHRRDPVEEEPEEEVYSPNDPLLDSLTGIDEEVARMHDDLNQGLNGVNQQLSLLREHTEAQDDSSPPEGAGAGPFSEGLVPAFRPPDYVHLRPLGRIYQVKLVQAQPGIDVTFSVTANGTNSDVTVSELELPEKTLGQYRILANADIRDGIDIQVDQLGRESMMYASKNQRGDLSTDTPGLTPSSNLTELFQFETRDLNFTIVEGNGDGSDLTVTFSGFMYHLSNEVSEAPEDRKVWHVPVGPFGGGAEFYEPG